MSYPDAGFLSQELTKLCKHVLELTPQVSVQVLADTRHKSFEEGWVCSCRVSFGDEHRYLMNILICKEDE